MVAALAWKSRQPFPREWCLVRDPVEREVDEIFDEPECPFHGAGNTGRCNHCEEDEE